MRTSIQNGVGSSNRSRRIQFIVLCVLIPLFLIPFYVVLSASFKSSSQADVSTMWQLPKTWTTTGITQAWKALKGNFINSIVMVLPAVVISSLIGSLNGFILSKYKFKYSNLLFTIMLVGMFIPYQAIMIPLVQFNKWSGLTGSIYVLVVSHIIYGIPICTLIFRNYYAGIPNEVIEAARVDGAGMVKIFRTIILPLSIPGFVVVLIWQFTSAWNDFLFAIFLTGGSPRLAVATTALNFITGSGNQVYYGNNMTASLIVSIPTLLVYMFLGRYFLRGLLSGSLKG